MITGCCCCSQCICLLLVSETKTGSVCIGTIVKTRSRSILRSTIRYKMIDQLDDQYYYIWYVAVVSEEQCVCVFA